MLESKNEFLHMHLSDYLAKLESGLVLGGGRWIADFNEAFRDYNLDGLTFDLLVVGSMRNRGFFVSRFLAWLTVPNYWAACFVYSGDPELGQLPRLLRTISKFMEKNEYTWSWLVLTKEGPFSRKARSMVESHNQHEIGIALVDLVSQEIVASKSRVGRWMPRFIKTFK